MMQLLEEFYVNTLCVSYWCVLGDMLRHWLSIIEVINCQVHLCLQGAVGGAKWSLKQAPRSSVSEILAGEVSLLSEVNICPVENLNTTRTDALGVFRSILARWSLFAACCVHVNGRVRADSSDSEHT